jgi:hypothetical protein
MLLMSKPDNSEAPFVLPAGTLERQKSKQMFNDIKLSYIKTTESRSANAHLNFNPNSVSNPRAGIGRTQDLPNFHR